MVAEAKIQQSNYGVEIAPLPVWMRYWERERELTDDDDIGGACGPTSNVGGPTRVDADVYRLRAVNDQGALARFRVKRGHVFSGHQHQIDLVLEPRDLGHRDATHGRRELARLAFAHHARLDRAHELGRLTARALHHLLNDGCHLTPRQSTQLYNRHK